MTNRRDNNDDKTAQLQRRLEHAQQELRTVAESGEQREPMLEHLEQHLHDNGFADRLLAAMLASKRRHA